MQGSEYFSPEPRGVGFSFFSQALSSDHRGAIRSFQKTGRNFTWSNHEWNALKFRKRKKTWEKTQLPVYSYTPCTRWYLLTIAAIEIVHVNPRGAVELPAGFVESLNAVFAQSFVLLGLLRQLFVVVVLQVFRLRASEDLIEALLVEIVVKSAAAPWTVTDKVEYQTLEESK